MANGQQVPDWFSTQSGVPSGAPALLSGQFGINQNTATGLMYYWDLFTTAWVAFGGGGSGFAPGFVSKTANYTLLTTDTGILGDATGGSIVLTLPTAVGSTAIYFLMKKDSGGNTVTIATTSSQTINGASTVVFSTQNAGIIVLSDNANWRIVAQVPATGGGGTGVTQSLWFAQSLANSGLSNGSFTDYPNLSGSSITVSITTAASATLRVRVRGSFQGGGTVTLGLRIVVDALTPQNIGQFWSSGGNSTGFSGSAQVTGLSAGAHTVKLQYITSGSTFTIDPAGTPAAYSLTTELEEIH